MSFLKTINELFEKLNKSLDELNLKDVRPIKQEEEPSEELSVDSVPTFADDENVYIEELEDDF